MKQFYILFAFLCLSFLGFNQTLDFDLTATDYATGKKLSNVTVEVYDGTSLVKTIVSPSNGNVKFSLPDGKIYIVFFSKSGKVTRQMKVNGKNIDTETMQGGKNALAYFSVSLFDQVGGIDYSYVEKNPITEFFFDGTNSKLAFDETIAAKSIKKVEEILKQSEAAANKIDALYNDAIAKADEFYKKKNCAEAVAKYNEALAIKSEQAVKDKISAVNVLIANQKKAAENESNYKKSIDNGETFFSQAKYADAKAAFNQALTYKPNDPTATKRLADIELKIKEESDLANKKKNYDAKIVEAEQLFAANKLAEAKVKFQEAKTIDSKQTYPDVKIKEIDTKLGEAEKNKLKEQQYNAAMKAADELFKANKLTEAKAKYAEASKIDPAQTKPTENIAKIDQLLLDQEKAKKEKEKADKITALLKEASGIYAKNDLENAKKKYQEVLTLDDKNAEATSKLNEINNKINAAQGEAEKTKRFNDLKTSGNQLMTQKKWAEAKQAFNDAKSIKADPEIDTKLKEIEKKIAEENAQQSADQQYNKILEDAKNLEASNIDQAILKYKEAQKLKPSDPVPTNKIKELEAKKTNNSAQAETDKKYNEAMKKGNDAMASQEYLEAIKFYNEAGKIKPSETEPTIKAKEAENLSKKLAQTEEEKNYNKILTTGQKYIDEKNWAKAKEMYNRAIVFRPTDIVPKNKLKEIDDLIKAEELAKKGNLDKEAAFTNKMKEAESAVTAKNYDKAITLFEEAKALKNTDPLPQKRIDDVKALKEKDSQSQQTDKLYQEYMSNGDKALSAKNYTQALSEFKNALNAKKNDKAATAKINEVQQLIDNATNAGSDTEFNKYKTEADAFFDQKKWQNAKESYEKALAIKNDRPTEKKYKEAIKNWEKDSEYAKQYKKVIDKADEYFTDKNYEKAKEYYERAITLNTTVNLTDEYPKEKLKEIDAILHPAAVAATGPLNALGEPTDKTPEEAMDELKKAQAIRDQSKNNVVVNKNTSAQNTAAETTLDKTEAIYDNNATFSEINKKNELNTEEGDLNRQNTVDEVEKEVVNINQTAIENTTSKYNENLNNTETVKNVNSEVSTEYTKKDLDYKENTESVKIYDQKSVDQTAKDSYKKYNTNIESQVELASTMVKVDESVTSDYEDRKEIDDQVKDVNSKISKNEYTNNSKESDNILNVDTKLQKENVIRSAKETEDAKTAGNNAVEVKSIEKKLVSSDIVQEDKYNTKNLNSDGVLATKNKVISDIPNQQDVNRKSNVNVVKTEGFVIGDNSREEYNKNVIKHLNNQEDITNTKISSDNLTDTKIANSKEIHAEIDAMDKSSKIAYTEKELSDDEQRANTKKDVTNTSITISEESTIKASKVDGNISEVQNVSTDISTKSSEDQLAKKQNLENSQVTLNKISNKEIKYDDKVANSLGASYPEGVSQEVFNQKDENDLLVAVVTRRIVVKNGYGQIYVRTQSLNGITYSKNGEPSSEFIWQKETGDSKLKKNY